MIDEVTLCRLRVYQDLIVSVQMNFSAQTVIIACVFVVALRKEQRYHIVNEYELAFCQSEWQERPYTAGVEIYVHPRFFAKIWEV
jgi:hypothetical protein